MPLTGCRREEQSQQECKAGAAKELEISLEGIIRKWGRVWVRSGGVDSTEAGDQRLHGPVLCPGPTAPPAPVSAFPSLWVSKPEPPPRTSFCGCPSPLIYASNLHSLSLFLLPSQDKPAEEWVTDSRDAPEFWRELPSPWDRNTLLVSRNNVPRDGFPWCVFMPPSRLGQWHTMLCLYIVPCFSLNEFTF